MHCRINKPTAALGRYFDTAETIEIYWIMLYYTRTFVLKYDGDNSVDWLHSETLICLKIINFLFQCFLFIIILYINYTSLKSHCLV